MAILEEINEKQSCSKAMFIGNMLTFRQIQKFFRPKWNIYKYIHKHWILLCVCFSQTRLNSILYRFSKYKRILLNTTHIYILLYKWKTKMYLWNLFVSSRRHSSRIISERAIFIFRQTFADEKLQSSHRKTSEELYQVSAGLSKIEYNILICN